MSEGEDRFIFAPLFVVSHETNDPQHLVDVNQPFSGTHFVARNVRHERPAIMGGRVERSVEDYLSSEGAQSS